MSHTFADYLFLSSLVLPVAGIVSGVAYLLMHRFTSTESHVHAVEVSAHG